MNKANGPQFDDRKPGASPDKPVEPGFLRELFNHVKVGVIATVVLAIIVSGLYPVVVWGLSQALFHDKANGSLVGKDGNPVTKDADAIGSALLGQSFSDAKYFHPRPSAAGNGYDATASSGSNLGPTSAKLMLGTTKTFAYTVFAADKSHTAVAPVASRVQGAVAEVTKTSITLATTSPATAPAGAAAGKTTYALDPSVADPNTIVAYHGRTVHAMTIPVGSVVELKLNDKTPPAVTAINMVDQELDGAPAGIDMSANKITLSDASSTVINVDPKSTVFVVNGKTDAKLTDLAADMSVHAVVSTQMDYDGVADRVIHYCQDNKIDYKSSVPDSAFMDTDGIDDAKLILALNAAGTPSITPATAVPADAVTASGSGLDPHITPANAELQKVRVAQARGISPEQVQKVIDEHTDKPGLGVLGDPGVNVLMVNLALDATPAATPQSGPGAAKP
ncbi:MAG: K+-transporting ATPase c chain-like protein [Phycisphaerales bacterium]|nr:K+-transporting ATPase c chain-like protein [Phycisphaerales bacterium]